MVGYRNTGIQRYRDTEIQGYRDRVRMDGTGIGPGTGYGQG